MPAVTPESVWDYPRPPRVVSSDEHVLVELGGTVVVDTRRVLRVLETSHPPGYYLPREDFSDGVLEPAPGSSFCEFKGTAAYLDVMVGGRRAERAGWYYPDPTSAYAALLDHVALYPGPFDRVRIDGELVLPQEGGFYGGWITSRVVGPFKGGPGSWGW